MALFGRESTADRDRVERVRLWAQARSPLALFSLMFGLLSVLDFFTMVLGVPLALAAILLGALGLRDLRLRPDRLGRRLCIAGIVLGCAGLMLGAAFFICFVLRQTF